MGGFSLVEMWNAMGPVAKGVVIILLIMSMISLGITIERLFTFNKAKAQGRDYILGLRPMVSQPGKLREAVGLDDRFKGSPVAAVIGAGIKEYARGLEALRHVGPDDVGDFDVVELVNRTMERHKERKIADLRRGLSFLATVSSSAPFVGLFGTVVGIIHSFQDMKTAEGAGIGAIAGGIAEALIETAFGLIVAVPAVWMYNYFTSKVESFVVEMDNSSSELIDYFLKQRGQ